MQRTDQELRQRVAADAYERDASLMSLRTWMDDNLATQGYCLAPGEARAPAIGLRLALPA